MPKKLVEYEVKFRVKAPAGATEKQITQWVKSDLRGDSIENPKHPCFQRAMVPVSNTLTIVAIEGGVPANEPERQIPDGSQVEG